MKKLTFIFVILGILLAELIFEWNQTAGYIIYSVLVGIVLISMEKDIHLNKSEMLLIFLMIVPIARISELFIPFGGVWKVFIFYAIIVFLALYYAGKFWIKSKEIELHDLSYPLILIIFSIVAMGCAEWIFKMENSIIIPLILFIAYAEEVLFRGEIQNLTADRFAPIYAILCTSILYGIFCITYGFPIFLFGFAASLILCFIYHFTKNLHLTFIINVIFHAVFFTFYAFVY